MSGEGDICSKCSAILWICLKRINLCPHVQLAEEVILSRHACVQIEDAPVGVEWGVGAVGFCILLEGTPHFAPTGESATAVPWWDLYFGLMSSLNLFNRSFMFSACQRGMLRWSNVPGSTLKYIAIVL